MVVQSDIREISRVMVKMYGYWTTKLKKMKNEK